MTTSASFPSHLRAVLFDLDGTLVDTADDLHFAVQTVKREASHLTQSIVSIAKEARMLNYGKWFDALNYCSTMQRGSEMP